MDGYVYRDDHGNYMVSLRVAGVEVDEAGPFDDETEAVLMAQRAVFGGGEVILPDKVIDKSSWMIGNGAVTGMAPHQLKVA